MDTPSSATTGGPDIHLPEDRPAVPPPRPRLIIATELDATEAKCHELQKALVVERAKVAALTNELRSFGVRKRKAKP